MSARSSPPAETQTLVETAIKKALQQDWKEAIHINTALIASDPNNIDALNRLAYAYLRLGESAKAKKHYQKVLKLDPYNQIASKNLKKPSTPPRKNTPQANGQVSPLMFLEEPGKTKIVALVNLAPQRALSTLSTGQEVFLKAKKHCVEIRDEENLYLGALPDDLSFKLIKFVSGGNQYTAVIKSIGKNQLIILLREIHRGKRFAHQPSFIASVSYISSASTQGEGPDTTPTGEESEEGTTEETPPAQ